jgi:Flp pilus assembly protein TadG
MKTHGVARVRRRRESGQSLIELVLVLPLLLLMVFGIVEFANAWRVYQVVTNSGREGARHAVLQASTVQSTTDRVNNRLQEGGLDPGKATIQVQLCPPAETKPCTGKPATVSVSYPYQFRMVGPIAGLICGNCGNDFGSVTLLTSAVMRNE